MVAQGKMADDWMVLRAAVPDMAGNYIWTIRAPKAQSWVPVYCGKAGGINKAGKDCKATLRMRFKDYINVKSFGPETEPHKYWAMLDAMSRGFSIEVR